MSPLSLVRQYIDGKCRPISQFWLLFFGLGRESKDIQEWILCFVIPVSLRTGSLDSDPMRSGLLGSRFYLAQ